MPTVNRFFQFVYPTVIFFSVLLAWSSIGQVNGYADFRGPAAHQNRPERTPAQYKAYCSAEQTSSPEAAPSCKAEASAADAAFQQPLGYSKNAQFN